MFPKKLKTDKCPACTVSIITYTVLTPRGVEGVSLDQVPLDIDTKPQTLLDNILKTLFNQSEQFLFADLLGQLQDGDGTTEDNLVADCLDHSYFLEEIK